ncbi:peptide-methionine (S)-S-oxide reductase MsrA [Comamonas odontotermitis]|uniref:peptide-methionine (S)-S-oxide reductase MsrA n=1 Tax=Comamonas odontotermitis TaxID=379895 RepID=UPI001CC786E9|nr:peptide-methionine (S)-S-oxide reductase MsrA [Comamonas odontotermitis]UBB18840.1 peptide-methionine (S)-S-oxide reductase MsrA [Comamonas odontotermitis]
MAIDERSTTEKIYLAGGCFWCTEAVFSRVRGVQSVTSGYANGHVAQPSYEAVCSGTTGHAECIELVFDPGVLPLAQVLQIFFATHDPTTPNRQGNDVGTQYRSGIYTTSAEQLAAVRAFVQQLADSGQFGAPVVTEVALLTQFWPAEIYHQEYFENNPRQPYCQYVVSPKVDKLETRFANWLK